jgi:hypothetical protein
MYLNFHRDSDSITLLVRLSSVFLQNNIDYHEYIVFIAFAIMATALNLGYYSDSGSRHSSY